MPFDELLLYPPRRDDIAISMEMSEDGVNERVVGGISQSVHMLTQVEQNRHCVSRFRMARAFFRVTRDSAMCFKSVVFPLPGGPRMTKCWFFNGSEVR